MSSCVSEKRHRNELKKKRDELCVFGFIRIHCTSFVFPKDLQQLCLTIYHKHQTLKDRWHQGLSHPKLYLHNKNRSIKSKSINVYNGFGTLAIDKGQCYSWQFQLSKKAKAMIGVIDIDKASPQMNGDFARVYNGGYAIYTRSGNKYGPKDNGTGYCQFNENHTKLTMTLDLTRTEGRLSYGPYNNTDASRTDRHIAFKDIDVLKNYCLAIAIMRSGTKVRIVQHDL
eukprot:119366_1